MFENSSIMVILDDNNVIQICRLEVDRSTQLSICKSFAESFEKLITDKEIVKFDGDYKAESDEILEINSYNIDANILKAIEEPIGVAAFIPNTTNQESIKAVFVEEKYEDSTVIAFQKFRKEQYITTKRHNLFFDKDTFIEEKRFGISISNNVDCIYINGNLQFESYHFARQIFDLSQYYRLATDGEVETFTQTPLIEFDNVIEFVSQTDSRVRRKIASILDSKVLEKYTATQIKTIGKKLGIEVVVKNKKVIIPNKKEEMKVILGFLDEEVYRGVFSNDTYITNSKRTVKKAG